MEYLTEEKPGGSQGQCSSPLFAGPLQSIALSLHSSKEKRIATLYIFGEIIC